MGKRKGKRMRGRALPSTAVVRAAVKAAIKGMEGQKRRRKRQRGRGFFSDLWSGIKGAASGVNNFLKGTKAISTVGNLLGDFGVPYAKNVANLAGEVGYARRGRRQRGRGIGNW